mmetsp:Transcript_6309/g.9553  ORF Transcript_6309/g.9553 Transcript_6309/m.9553 type:complete len:125 (+) Transcript_6309:44-418(+)
MTTAACQPKPPGDAPPALPTSTSANWTPSAAAQSVDSPLVSVHRIFSDLPSCAVRLRFRCIPRALPYPLTVRARDVTYMRRSYGGGAGWSSLLFAGGARATGRERGELTWCTAENSSAGERAKH